MKNHNSGTSGFIALKIEISKVYDRVEWIFLEKLMRRMDICTRLIDLIIECVSTISYTLLVNGETEGMFKPTKGIRQGDPPIPLPILIMY